MKKQKNSNGKKAFTLIELLIVIGIIGVLSSVMLGLLGGSNNSARATQCMTNMRGLSVAVINYTMQDKDGSFPPAGTFKYKDLGTKSTHHTRRGWISWGSSVKNNDTSASCAPYVMFHDSDTTKLMYAITNGCIWETGGMSASSYVCPTHVAACLKSGNKTKPGWSYVMNESFYWDGEGDDTDKGKRKGQPFKRWRSVAQGASLSTKDVEKNRRMDRPPSKVLLFAEIQGLTDKKRNLVANVNGSGDNGDCVLQYYKGNEVIGFNHEQSGGKLAGHVAFADGHVEKFLYPDSLADAKQLTQWLGSGREVSFNGHRYQDLSIVK